MAAALTPLSRLSSRVAGRARLGGIARYHAHVHHPSLENTTRLRARYHRRRGGAVVTSLLLLRCSLSALKPINHRGAHRRPIGQELYL